MNEFDDPTLRDQLGQLSGPYPDENRARVAVQRKLARARKRRAAAWTSGTAVVVLLVVGAYVTGLRQGDDTLRPGSTGSSVDRSTTIAPPGSDEPTSTTTTSSATTTEPQPTTPGTGTSVRPSVTTGPAIIGGASTTAPVVGGPPTTTRSNTTTPTTTASGQTSTIAPSALQIETYSGVGGSITVRLQNGTLTLLSSTPADGFDGSEVREEQDQVEVRFRSDTRSTRVRVTIVAGQLSGLVQEEGD